MEHLARAPGLVSQRHRVPCVQIEGISCDPSTVKSNLVMFDVSATGVDAGDFCTQLRDSHQVWMGAKDERWIRAAIHHQVSEEGVVAAAKAVAAVAAAARA